jgi:hypothetical protein
VRSDFIAKSIFLYIKRQCQEIDVLFEVLADLLGADMFTNSFGLLLLFQGIATFIGPPVVGQ